jgi:DNA-binding protein YbaB
MGVMDMANMARKAMQARSRMSKINAAGKAGSLAILIDGLYTVLEIEIDKEELRAELGEDFTDSMIDKVVKVFSKNIKQASNNSKKSLEQELSKSTSIDDLKDLLSE